jgi:hypothetical protein
MIGILHDFMRMISLQFLQTDRSSISFTYTKKDILTVFRCNLPAESFLFHINLHERQISA